VPARWNVNEKRAPGAIVPEFQPDSSEVDVCDSRSVFVHVTVDPVATLISSGMYARFPSDCAPTGIATADDESFDGVGDVGDGAVVGDPSDPPHATTSADTVTTRAKRTKYMKSLLTIQ
jgi:hypothetical protein